ncbi:MAG: hypothetical protein JWM74_5245, partial [Myxococcaceae bacterium]|nr:hypothetical protein [Myxococcaceae bacterium]
RAAMDGKSGSPSSWFDYQVAPPPRALQAQREGERDAKSPEISASWPKAAASSTVPERA